MLISRISRDISRRIERTDILKERCFSKIYKVRTLATERI